MTNVSVFVGKVIRELRGQTSQTELAKALGVATNTVSRWETGTYKPSLDDLWKMTEHFGVPASRFFPRNTNKESVNLVGSVHICDACLEGEGGECHSPGCLLWLNRGPDLPIRDAILERGGTIEPLGDVK